MQIAEAAAGAPPTPGEQVRNSTFAPQYPPPPIKLASSRRLKSVLTDSDLERFLMGHPYLSAHGPAVMGSLLPLKEAHFSLSRNFCPY